jgi:hypothetical protein
MSLYGARPFLLPPRQREGHPSYGALRRVPDSAFGGSSAQDRSTSGQASRPQAGHDAVGGSP